MLQTFCENKLTVEDDAKYKQPHIPVAISLLVFKIENYFYFKPQHYTSISLDHGYNLLSIMPSWI